MCGRAKLDSDWSELVEYFDLDLGDLVGAPDGRWVRRYNIAPTDLVPIITGAPGARHAQWASWGFVPFWEKTAKPKSRPINAMAESVATNGVFKGAFARGRCVVPATGFYEWAEHPPGSGAGGKQPFLFSRVDRKPMALAGVWSRWRPDPATVAEAVKAAEDKGREVAPWLKKLQAEGVLATYAVLTTTPNVVTGKVHDRMPVVLPDAAAIDAWLDERARVDALLRPAPDDLLDARPVNPAMGSVKVDTAEGCAVLE